MIIKKQPNKCKKCNVEPEVIYGTSGGWKHFQCPKCGQKSKSFQNQVTYDNAVNFWNHLNE